MDVATPTRIVRSGPVAPPGVGAIDRRPLQPLIDPSAGHHVVWVVSPPGYVHAHAFDEVAVALAEGLGELGAPVPVVHDHSVLAGTVPIVLGSHLLDRASWSLLPPGAVLVNLEQVDGASTWFGDDHLELLSRHPVLDYSPRNLAALHRIGIGHARLLGIGVSPGLARIPARRSGEIDVCFYGSTNPRRVALLDELERRGLVVERLFGVYGAERDAAIARAKVVVNCHYYESSVFEVVRVSYLLANGVCVVTEGDPHDPDVAPWRDGLVATPYDQLADACEALVHDASRRSELAASATATAWAHPQADRWRTLLDELATSGPRDTVAPPTGAAGQPSAPRPLQPAAVRAVTLVIPAGDGDARRRASTVAAALDESGVAVVVHEVAGPRSLRRTGLRCTIEPGDGAATGGQRDPATHLDHRDDHLLVLDASLGAVAPELVPLRVALWWCGVDDIVTGTGSLADPAVLDRVLATPGVTHLHQSAYAREFLRSRGVASTPLPDPVPAPPARPSPAGDGRSHVVVGPPGHPLVATLIARCAGIDVRPLGPDPDEHEAELAAALAYVHVAGQPGRAALPRLAAVNGAIVLTLAAGAARFVEDVAVPDAYRFVEDDIAGGALTGRIRTILAAPERARHDQAWFRDRIAAERDELRRAVRLLVDPD